MPVATLSQAARARADAVKDRISKGNIGYLSRLIGAKTPAEQMAVAAAADQDHRDLWQIASSHEAKLDAVRNTVMDALRAGTPQAAARALNTIEAMLRVRT